MLRQATETEKPTATARATPTATTISLSIILYVLLHHGIKLGLQLYSHVGGTAKTQARVWLGLA